MSSRAFIAVGKSVPVMYVIFPWTTEIAITPLFFVNVIPLYAASTPSSEPEITTVPSKTTYSLYGS